MTSSGSTGSSCLGEGLSVLRRETGKSEWVSLDRDLSDSDGFLFQSALHLVHLCVQYNEGTSLISTCTKCTNLVYMQNYTITIIPTFL